MLEDRNAPNGFGNSSPFAADDWFDLLHDTTLFANLLWNDCDPDGDTLSITRINGQTYTPGTQIALQEGDLVYGYLTVEQDSSFTFTPSLRYKGPVTFSYTISDGEYESTAWVTINVFNNEPVLSDQWFSILHDQDLMGNLLSGAYDPDGDIVRITHINGQAVTYGEAISLPSGASLTIFADGTSRYTPPSNFVGSDSFSLTISDDLDSYTAMVNIQVTNNAPYAYDASFSILHDRELTGQLYGYDPDGDTITAQLVSGPTNGTLTLHADGSFTYTPNTHYVGPDSFTYTRSDGLESSNIGTVTIDVYNNAPYGYGATFYVQAGQVLSGQLCGNDPDGDSIAAILDTGPVHGTLELHQDGTFTYTAEENYLGTDSFSYVWSDGISESAVLTVTLVVHNGESPIAFDASFSVLHDQAVSSRVEGYDPNGDQLTAIVVNGPSHGILDFRRDGSFTYTPTERFVGSDGFTYQWSDGVHSSNIASVTIEVYNTPPTGSGNTYAVRQGEVLQVAAPGLLESASDEDGDPVTAFLAQPPEHGTLTLNADGSFTYMPEPGYVGLDIFGYQLGDGIGASEVIWVSIYVHEDRPLAIEDTYTLSHDQVFEDHDWGVLSNDFDPTGNPLVAILVTPPEHGTITLREDGTFRYIPEPGYIGVDAFAYKVSNGVWESPASRVKLQISNKAPIVYDQAWEVLHDHELANVSLLAGWDADGDKLRVAAINGVPVQYGQPMPLPSGATVTVQEDGTLKYQPPPGYSGTDSFQYTLTDGINVSENPGTALVSVNNTPPIANPDYFQTNAGQSLMFSQSDLLRNDYDPDGDNLFFVSISPPQHGILQLDGQTYTYTSDAGFTGEERLTYVISDGEEEASSEVVITVSNWSGGGGGGGPTLIARDDVYVTGAGDESTLTVPELYVPGPGVLANDVYPSGTTPEIVIQAYPQNGNLTLLSGGGFRYISHPDFAGTDTFIYYLKDSNGNTSNRATVKVHVVKIELEEAPQLNVPINADNDNGSPVTNEIPAVRDFDKVMLTRADPDLRPVHVRVTPDLPAILPGLFRIKVTSSGYGRIALWQDPWKRNRVNLTQTYTSLDLPRIIYVEGLENSQRLSDVIMTIQFRPFKLFPGGGLGSVIASADLKVSVTPVVTLVERSIGTNQERAQVIAGQVYRGVMLRGAPSGSFSQPIRAMLLQEKRYGERAPADWPGVVFVAQAYRDGLAGQLVFIQNLLFSEQLIPVGGKFAYAKIDGGREWIFLGRELDPSRFPSGRPVSLPLLDSPLATSPDLGDYYGADRNKFVLQATGSRQAICAEDSPFIGFPPHLFDIVVRLARKQTYRTYLAWRWGPKGAGVIWPLGYVTWWYTQNFYRDPEAARGALRLDPTTRGFHHTFRHSHDVPELRPPLANDAYKPKPVVVALVRK